MGRRGLEPPTNGCLLNRDGSNFLFILASVFETRTGAHHPTTRRPSQNWQI